MAVHAEKLHDAGGNKRLFKDVYDHQADKLRTKRADATLTLSRSAADAAYARLRMGREISVSRAAVFFARVPIPYCLAPLHPSVTAYPRGVFVECM